MTKSVVLLGAGKRAEKFLIQYFNKIQITEVWDNLKDGLFYGYQIQRPCYKRDVYIVVTVDGYPLYYKLRQQLLELEYREFEDFIPYTIYQKKVALAYGNCHMNAVRQYMELHVEFAQDYGFYPIAPIQAMKDTLQMQDIVPQCDLIIHQGIRRENGYGEAYASEEILKGARTDCRMLSIPNLYGMPECFFPQLQKKKIPDTYGHIDKNIVKWVENNVPHEEMKQRIQDGGIYSHQYIMDLWEEFRRKLEDREKEWDIKISDYIYAHYKKQKLFTDRWHISTFLAKEIAERVLETLGYASKLHSILPCLDDYEVFIYRDVKETLGLQFEESCIRSFIRTSRLDATEMSLEAYIEMCVQIYLFEHNT